MVLHMVGNKRSTVERAPCPESPPASGTSSAAVDGVLLSALEDSETVTHPAKNKPHFTPPPCSPKVRRLAIGGGPSSPSSCRQMPSICSGSISDGPSVAVAQYVAPPAAPRQDYPGAVADASTMKGRIGATAATGQSKLSQVFGAVAAYSNPRVAKALQMACRSSTGYNTSVTSTCPTDPHQSETSDKHGNDLEAGAASARAASGDAAFEFKVRTQINNQS